MASGPRLCLRHQPIQQMAFLNTCSRFLQKNCTTRRPLKRPREPPLEGMSTDFCLMKLSLPNAPADNMKDAGSVKDFRQTGSPTDNNVERQTDSSTSLDVSTITVELTTSLLRSGGQQLWSFFIPVIDAHLSPNLQQSLSATPYWNSLKQDSPYEGSNLEQTRGI